MYRIILSVVILRVRKIIYLLNTKNEIEWVFIWNDQLFCKYKRAYDQLHAKIKRTHKHIRTQTHTLADTSRALSAIAYLTVIVDIWHTHM